MADPKRSRGDRLFIDDNTYSPEALSDMRRADVVFDPTQYRPEDSDPVSMTEFAKDRLIDMGQGFSDIPGYVANYLVRPDEAGQMSFIPPAEFASDAKNVATAMGQAAYEDPLAFATEMLPVASNVVSGIESNKLFKQADELDAQGRGEEASKLRSMASFASMDMLNPLPTAYLTGLVGDLLTPSVDVPKMGMVQKVKGGTFLEPQLYKRYDEALTDKVPSDLKDSILKKIKKYRTTQLGTVDDPIRAALLRGDLKLEINKDQATNFDGGYRGVSELPNAVLKDMRQQSALAGDLAVIQNRIKELNATRVRGPMGEANAGFRSAEDLQEIRALEKEKKSLEKLETGLDAQTESRQYFDRVYDDSNRLEGIVIENDLLDSPDGEPQTFNFNSNYINEQKADLKGKVETDIEKRRLEYQELLNKRVPNQPFEGFANQAELNRFNDLAYGSRFPEEAGPFAGGLTGPYQKRASELLNDKRMAKTSEERLELIDRFRFDETLRRAIDDGEIIFTSPNFTRGDSAFEFTKPEIVAESISLLDPKKLKNMTYPDMVIAGQQARIKRKTEIYQGEDPAELAKDIYRDRKNIKKIEPQALLKKGVEPITTAPNGTIFRIKTTEGAALEGALMNHSVGGYNEPKTQPGYNRGGQKSFNTGESRVYSLRDPETGLPRVTFDIKFDLDTGLPKEVYQIKGYKNATDFLNYTPDFDLIFEFLTNIGVTRNTPISEGEGNIRASLEKAFNAEGGVASLANGGQAEYGITTL